MNKLISKLLANENITIEEGDFSTASFNVNTRTLKLPAWENITNDVSTLFVGHEVGHALYTPIDRPDGIPHGLLNAVEDIRIEKLIQQKYLGLVSNFKKGYKELINDEFFGDLSNISNESFLNRLNVNAKTGIEVGFDDKEQIIIDKSKHLSTWDDTISLCEDILKMIQDNIDDKNDEPEEQESNIESESGDSQQDIGSNEEPQDNDDLSDSSDGKSNEEPEGDDDLSDNPNGSSDGESNEEPEDTCSNSYDSLEDELNDSTMQNLEENKNKLAPVDTGFINDINLDEFDILPYSEVFSDHTSAISTNIIQERWEKYFEKCYDKAKKDANHLAMVFKRKQSAYRNSRTKVSNSGELDPLKLVNYKTDDNIFLSKEMLRNGKNHGIFFVIDNSSSMRYSMKPVWCKMFTLMMFANKLNIPFKSYSFTTYRNDYINKGCKFGIDVSNLNIVERTPDKMTNKTIKQMFRNYILNDFLLLEWSSRMDFLRNKRTNRMGITPEIETKFVMNKLASKFKNKHNLQTLNFVLFSDGDPSMVKVDKWANNYNITIDNKVYKVDGKSKVNKCISDHLSSKFNTLHFFFHNSNRSPYILNNEEWRQLKRDRVFIVDDSEYTKKMVLLLSEKSNIEFQFDENKNTTTQFKKHRSKVKITKNMLNEVAEALTN